MKIKLEIGKYIRTNSGIIAKCIEEKHDRFVFDKIVIEEGYYNNYIFKDISERANFIAKCSFNMKDILKIGDIIHIILPADEYYKEPIETVWYIDRLAMLNNIKNQIESKELKLISILTKEQFENERYKI